MISDDAWRKFQVEFLDGANDGLDRVDAAIDDILRIGPDCGVGIGEIRREIHTLKGQGATFGFPMVTAILHRMEDFLSDESDVTPKLAQQMNSFLDPVRKILAEGKDPGNEAGAALLRSLPARSAKVEITVEPVDIEVLIGLPSGVTAHIVRQVLNNCGYRAVRAKTFMEIFATALRSKPDAIIVSQTLDEFSGADLVQAIAAIPAFHQKPIGILTSFDPKDAIFKSLPDRISLIRAGQTHFDEDLASFLTRVSVREAA